MKFDLQIPLTASQFERLKPSKNLKADLVIVLPKAKHERIQTFLNDPVYLFRVVRPFKGSAAYLLLRMQRPIEIIKTHPKLHRLIQKGARTEGVTVNQFIQGAVRSQLDKMEGKR